MSGAAVLLLQLPEMGQPLGDGWSLVLGIVPCMRGTASAVTAGTDGQHEEVTVLSLWSPRGVLRRELAGGLVSQRGMQLRMPEPCSRSGPFSCFREEAQRCEELPGHHGMGRAVGAAPSLQAADPLWQFLLPALAVPCCWKGSPTACTVAQHSLGMGCAAGAGCCRDVCPVGVLAERIRAAKWKTLAWKQGVTVGAWEWDCLAGSCSNHLLSLLVAGSRAGERATAVFDLSHLSLISFWFDSQSISNSR